MRNKKSGFTLIEIMIAVAIISMLAIGGLASYSASLRNSRDAKRKTDLEQIKIALEIYKGDTGSYPAAVAGDTEVSGGLKSVLTSPPPYINSSNFPKDPSSGNFYYYQRTSVSTYRLCSLLENTGGVATPCPGTPPSCGSGNCMYGVTEP